MDLLARLTRNLPLTLAVLALVVLLIVIALVLLVRRKRVPPAAAAGEEPAPADAVVVDFRQGGSHHRLATAFRRALAELRRHLGTGDSRYRLPWYVLLGEEAAGKSRLFPDSGLNLPLGTPEEPAPDKGEGCAFWFFDHGVVIDVSGEYVLGAGGGTPNPRGWRHFLALLRENRPERPLDGVVLAIPCGELIGPPEGEGARLAAAAEKGAELFRKLRQAQEALGMNFPVYVLITGCERIPGFESYVAEIPGHLRGDLFGWSSPYSPEIAYRSEWLDEAFTALGAGLHRAQLAAFGDQAVLEDPDGVFCFPEEVQRLRGPLRVYLNQIFRASAYHELLIPRGLYLCGRIPEADRSGALLRDSGAVGSSVFVRDTFDRKVFPERDLARPTVLALVQGGRRLRGLQAAVVILTLVSTLGLGWAAHRLGDRKDDLRVFLLGTAQDLEETRDRRLKGAAEHEFVRDKAFHLFDGMSRLNAGWFGSVFIPSSWFSPFNHDLKQAIVRAYNEIILTTLYQELGRSLDRILATSKPVSLAAAVEAAPAAAGGGGGVLPTDRFIAWAPKGTEAADLRPLERTPEFTRLSGYVGSLRELETHIGLYNRLRTTESLEDLNDVVHYLFAHDLPKGFFENSQLYARALADVAYTRFQPLQQRPRTTRQAGELADALFERLFGANPAAADLRGAAALVGAVSEATFNPAEGGDTVTSLIELRTRLKRAEGELASPDLAWMAGDNLDLGPPWQQLLQATRATIFLGPETADAFQAEGAQRFQDFRRGLFAIETRSTGALVVRDAKSGALALSPPAKLLADALDGLSQQGFVAAAVAAGTPAAATLAPRGRVTWDTVTLQQAAGLYKPYEDFIEKTLEPFPPDLRNTLQISARDRLGARMMNEVADAQQAGPQPDLGSALLVEQVLDQEVANFQAASGPLGELTDRFGKLGLFAAKDQVAAAFVAQGAQILADADRLLVLRAPYTPKGSGFDWWTGGRRLSLDAFGARDEAELAAYLGAQRSEVADLSARYAEPVIQALGGKATSRPLRASLARWTAIGDQLRRYAAKEPGNSVAGLEELLLKDLADVEPANCTRRISARMLAEPAADFFQERRGALRRQVWDRCLVLAGGQAAEGYGRLADFFNQRLAGKFPFAAAPPGRLDAEADPADLRAFFQLYATYAPIVRAVPEADRPPGTGEFIDRMAAVRAFFAAFLDDPARPASPAFDLAVRFRENRRGEKGGDQILRWSLAAGEQVAIHPNARPALPWAYGTPVRLELQWAKDSPVIPVESADLPGVHVEGRTAVLELRDRWSLLALVRGWAGAPEATEPGTELLRLQVATRPEADPKAAPELARVFVGLALRAPERRDKSAGKDAAATAGAAPAAAPAPGGDLEVPAFPLAAPAWKVKADAS